MRKIYNRELIDTIDGIISIVSLGRSARSRANIKNRQPLEEVLIYLPKDKILPLDKVAQNEILEELNIKSLRFVDDPSIILSYDIKPNFPILKERFDYRMKEIISEINKLDNKTKINMINNDGAILIEIGNKNEKILKNELIIDEISKDGVSSSSLNGIVVGISTKISDTLLKRGYC